MTTWQDEAACAPKDGERDSIRFARTSWFFEKDDAGRFLHEATAKALCEGCPVQDECLNDALVNNDKHAIRGGTTPAERRKL